MIERAEIDSDFFKRIVSGDESWCFAYDIATSAWTGENSPRTQKLRIHNSRVKTMLVIFFDWKGIVHKELYRKDSLLTLNSTQKTDGPTSEKISGRRPEKISGRRSEKA